MSVPGAQVAIWEYPIEGASGSVDGFTFDTTCGISTSSGCVLYECRGFNQVVSTDVEACTSIGRMDRKTRILEETLSLLAQKGVAGTTHRAVDEAAGLPQGSTSYYFSRKALLLEAAAGHLATVIEEDCEQVRRHFAHLVAAGRRDEAIEYVCRDLLKYAEDGRTQLLARFEIEMAGARAPELLPAANGLSEVARKPIEFFLRQLSDDLSESRVDACVGILDGLALRYVTGQGPKPSIEQIERVFRSA